MANSPSPVPWYFPAADAVVSDRRAAPGKAKVEIFQTEGDFANRILVAGCDPGISVLARHVQSSGAELVLAHRNSSQALELLKRGSVHIAGTHLKHDGFPKSSMAVISFAIWEEGIITAPGNPKSIRTIADLTGKNITIVNREKGSGCRALLDTQLASAAIPSSQIQGYHRDASGHMAAAWEVRTGAADCCIATRAAVTRLRARLHSARQQTLRSCGESKIPGLAVYAEPAGHVEPLQVQKGIGRPRWI